MAARENYYAESTGDSSTTSTSAQTKVTLNWTPGAASTDYLVIWSAQIRINGTSSDVIVEFKDDGGTVRGQANHENKDATDYHAVFGIWKYTSSGSPSAISFTLTYRSEGGSGVNIREARIFVMRMGADDAYAALDSTDTETTTSFEVAANLTFTPPSIGDYLIIGSCEMNFSSVSGESIHKLTHGGTDYGTAQVRPKDATNYAAAGVVVKKSLAASSQSIDWNFARSSTAAGTASCRNSRIAAIRLDAFADNYYGEVRASRSTTTSATYSNYATVTDTPLAARDHLIIGSCVRDCNSTADSAFTKLRTAGGDLTVNTLQEGVVASTSIDLPAWCQMLRRTEAASSTTWSVAYASEGGTSTGINEGAIIVLDLEAVGATAYEIAADAGSYAVTGQTAGTLVARKVAADAGSYALSGTDAMLRRNLPMVADAGSYALTGQTADVRVDRKVAADAGSYALNGTDAALSKGLTLGAAAGSYALSGQDAALEHDKLVDAGAGSYALSGQDATLRRDLPLVAESGAYVLTGSDAGLIYSADEEFCPEGVTFDGTNDYLTRGAPLTGLSDGRQGSVSFWLRRNGTGAGQQIFRSDNGSVSIDFDGTSGVVSVLVADSSQSSALVFASTGSLLADGDWHNVLIAWDTDFSAGNKLADIYIDDAQDVTVFADGQAAFDIAYATGVSDWAVGARTSGANKLNGDLARFWFSPEYIDFSIEANRRKFIAADGGAEWLGSNGSLPTSNQPILYLEGPAADFHLNRGSGGDFTVTGTLTDAATDPPCAGQIVVAAEAGSYALTGVDAALLIDRIVSADAGSYALNGTDATLSLGKRLAADAGAYSLTGSDAALLVDRVIGAGAGSYALNGQDAAFNLGKTLAADAGSYNLTGNDADLELARLIAANAGGYVLTGSDAMLTVGKFLAAEDGAYALVGSDADLFLTRNIGTVTSGGPGGRATDTRLAGAAAAGRGANTAATGRGSNTAAAARPANTPATPRGPGTTATPR